MATKLIRIKPYNKKQGCVLLRITLSALNGKRFEAGRWYRETNPAMAEQLATVNQDGTMTDEPKTGMPRAFDIMDEEAQAKLVADELRVATGAPTASTIVEAPDRDSKGDAPKVAKPKVSPPARPKAARA